ncbi:MAG: kelch repeat-containing protein [Gemmatimonadales bacterium]
MQRSRASLEARLGLVCFSAAIHLGCSGGETVAPPPPPPPTAPVATVTIQPGSFNVIAGSTRQLYARVQDAQGNLLARSVTWTSSAPAEHSAVLLPDGTVLVAGGSGGGAELNPMDSSEIYDPTTGTWTAAGDMNAARGAGLTSTILGNGSVLIAGGARGRYASPQLVAKVRDLRPRNQNLGSHR